MTVEFPIPTADWQAIVRIILRKIITLIGWAFLGISVVLLLIAGHIRHVQVPAATSVKQSVDPQ